MSFSRSSLNTMISDQFPLRSTEYPEGSPQNTEYISCMNKVRGHASASGVGKEREGGREGGREGRGGEGEGGEGGRRGGEGGGGEEREEGGEGRRGNILHKT